MQLDANVDLGLGSDVLDVLVVGGGVAGAYTAWRLKTGSVVSPIGGLPVDTDERRIALIEASGRIGGRLESLHPPGAPELTAEFGGMGFTSNNTIVTALVDDVFQIPAEPFPRGGDANLFYLRGERFTKGELKAGTASLPYKIDPTSVEQGPIMLVVKAVTKVFGQHCMTWTAKQWRQKLESFTWNGRNLRDVGFWNFLLMNMTAEEFAFAHDATGHFFEVSNWNCAEALPWFLGDGAAAYRTITDGYDLMPQYCAQAFMNAGGLLQLGISVTGVRQDPGDDALTVTLDQEVEIKAKRVVLALPRRALDIITPNTPALQAPGVAPALESVTGHKVMKIFLAFDEPWWEQLGITDGSTSSDLPLGQVWYFSPPKGSTNTKALLMASYNDTLATTYWEGLEGDSTFVNPSNSGPFWQGQSPSELMVHEVVRQLTLVHGINIPQPYAAAYKDWSPDPYGGAFYTWNVGVDAATVETVMQQPDPSVAVHVVGSAYSSDQGWAEGALQTSERLLEERIGLDRPSWITAQVD
ncbi:MAG: NAD(P)/FAD-dependent oxidoreductase [Actinomycetota bacterium]